MSIKIYSLTLSHISSAVGFVCKCLQLNNKNSNTQKALSEVNTVESSMIACLNIRSRATNLDSQRTAEAGHSVKELDVMCVSKRQDTALSTQLDCSGTHWLHSVGLKEVKEHLKQSHFPSYLRKKGKNVLYVEAIDGGCTHKNSVWKHVQILTD